MRAFEQIGPGRIRGQGAREEGSVALLCIAVQLGDANEFVVLHAQVTRDFCVDVSDEGAERHSGSRLLFVHHPIDLGVDRLFELLHLALGQHPSAFQEARVAKNRVALAPYFDLALIAVLRRVVRTRVPHHSIGLHNEERGPRPGTGVHDQPVHQLVASEYVVSVHLVGRNSVSQTFLDEIGLRRLLLVGNRDSPAVVNANEDAGHLPDAREIEPRMEAVRAGRSVAEVDRVNLVPLSQLGCVGGAYTVRHLSADDGRPTGIVRRLVLKVIAHLTPLGRVVRIAVHLRNVLGQRQAPHQSRAPFTQSRPEPVTRLHGGRGSDHRGLLPKHAADEADSPRPLQLEHALVDAANAKHVHEQVLQPTICIVAKLALGHPLIVEQPAPGLGSRLRRLSGRSFVHCTHSAKSPGFSSKRFMVTRKRAALAPSDRR